MQQWFFEQCEVNIILDRIQLSDGFCYVNGVLIDDAKIIAADSKLIFKVRKHRRFLNYTHQIRRYRSFEIRKLDYFWVEKLWNCQIWAHKWNRLSDSIFWIRKKWICQHERIELYFLGIEVSHNSTNFNSRFNKKLLSQS